MGSGNLQRDQWLLRPSLGRGHGLFYKLSTVEYTAQSTILVYFSNGAAVFSTCWSTGAIAYFRNFCFYSIVKLRGHGKFLSIRDMGQSGFCQSVFNEAMPNFKLPWGSKSRKLTLAKNVISKVVSCGLWVISLTSWNLLGTSGFWEKWKSSNPEYISMVETVAGTRTLTSGI